MLAGRELGHDPPVGSVDLVLGQDDIAQDPGLAVQDGSRGFIAGCFDGQDIHGPAIIAQLAGRPYPPPPSLEVGPA